MSQLPTKKETNKKQQQKKPLCICVQAADSYLAGKLAH